MYKSVKGKFEPCPECKNHSPSSKAGLRLNGKPSKLPKADKGSDVDNPASGSFNLSKKKNKIKITMDKGAKEWFNEFNLSKLITYWRNPKNKMLPTF